MPFRRVPQACSTEEDRSDFARRAGARRLGAARARAILDAQVDIVWRVVEAGAVLADLGEGLPLAQHAPHGHPLLEVGHAVSKAREEALHPSRLSLPFHGRPRVGIGDLNVKKLLLGALLLDVTLDLEQLPLVFALLLLHANLQTL